MAFNILSVVLTINVVIIYGQPVNNCDNGPGYWCTNAETAKECGAVEVCEMIKSDKIREAIQANDVNSTADASPVEVTLFFEALCPYCRNFIQRQLYPAFQRLHSTGILKVKLYAYGNANERWDGTKWVFRCQHGERECQLNLLETCAFNELTDDQKVPFIHCLETNPRVENGKKCLQEVGADWMGVYSCYAGAEGNKLQHEVAKLQKTLNPRLKFVPWILVNGYHTDALQGAVQRNMLSYVCNAYTGSKPSACYSLEDEQ